MTWSESKLMIGNQTLGEEEGFNVGSDDGFLNLADEWENTCVLKKVWMGTTSHLIISALLAQSS